MENVSELLLRNEQRFKQPGILLINPPRDAGFRMLSGDSREVRLFTQDFGDYQWFLANGASVEYGLIPGQLADTSDVVLIQPRERNRLDMMLHALAAASPPGRGMWLAGEIRTGIKSAGKNLANYFTRVNKTDNARHCVLYEATNPIKDKPFLLTDYEQFWTLPAPWNDVKIVSLPGTFAHGKLDQGTRLLLEAMQEQAPRGRVLDFACGAGVVGLVLLAQHADVDLTLLDTSALALESAQRTLQTNECKAKLLPSDGLSEVDGRFDWIISNPPFHRGVANDLEIARRFFSQAGKHLAKTGRMLLVYNQHLPYQGWLGESFPRVEIVRQNQGFKVALVSGASG